MNPRESGNVRVRNFSTMNSNLKASVSGMDLYSGALELIQDAVVIIDVAGKLLFLNKVAEQLTGWHSYEAIGRPATVVLKIAHATTHALVPDPVKAVLHESSSPEFQGKLILLSKDGAEFPIADTGSARRSKNGRMTAIYLIFRQWSSNAGSADDSKAILNSHLEAIGALAGGIAHDFNNVLTAVVGNLSLARIHVDQPEKTRGRLEQAEKASLRARELSRQLLTFAKGGAPIKTCSYVQESIAATAAQAIHEENVSCEFELPEDIWSVEIDLGQFNLAVRNLVTHAAHSSPPEGRIEISAANVTLSRGMVNGLKPGNYLRISIRDFGEGIPSQRLNRIFEPYFITRKTGSGLGLATSFSIIRRHEGTISVESIQGKGTTFHIFLPASTHLPEPESLPIENIAHHGSGRILVMDDEADVRLVACDMLEIMGYEVETSPDGGHAVQLYAAAKKIGKPFAAVIFDLTIPAGMGGKEAVLKLREIDPGARAIVSSGYSYDPVMANFSDHGFDGVVPKPYKAEELARTLNRVIGNHRVTEMEAY